MKAGNLLKYSTLNEVFSGPDKVDVYSVGEKECTFSEIWEENGANLF